MTGQQSTERTKVLYIAGAGRSGSTILAAILGQLPAFFAVGDLRYVWERGFIKNQDCGCGEAFMQCPTWHAIVRAAFGASHDVDSARWNDATTKFTRTRQILRWIGRGGASVPAHGMLRDYVEMLGRLYTAIATATGSRVVVDSSKFPVYGGILSLIPSLDLRWIHVVRDPRAVAYSWSKPKRAPGSFVTEPTPRIGPASSTLRWTIWNWASTYLGGRAGQGYRLVRYEDFVRHPQQTIVGLARFVGEDPDDLPFESSDVVTLRPNHTVAGNPSRFGTGRVQIKPDSRWLSRMSWSDWLLVSLLGWPGMRQYGYPFGRVP